LRKEKKMADCVAHGGGGRHKEVCGLKVTLPKGKNLQTGGWRPTGVFPSRTKIGFTFQVHRSIEKHTQGFMVVPPGAEKTPKKFGGTPSKNHPSNESTVLEVGSFFGSWRGVLPNKNRAHRGRGKKIETEVKKKRPREKG